MAARRLLARSLLALVLACLAGLAVWDRVRVEQVLGRQEGQIQTLAAESVAAAETNRGVLCAWLFTLAANPPPNPTPDQSIRFMFYRDLYGDGVEGTPGLKCPRPLPGGGG